MDQATTSIYRREALLAQAQATEEMVPLPSLPRWTSWLVVALVVVPGALIALASAIRIDIRIVVDAASASPDSGLQVTAVLPAAAAGRLAPGLRCELMGEHGRRVGAVVDAVEARPADDAVLVRVRPDQPIGAGGPRRRVAIVVGDETLLHAIVGAVSPARRGR